MAFRRGRNCELATPLCLPNNCIWDSRNGTFSTTSEERKTLNIVPEALEKLQAIKGPVCVVAVAGPYRKGKSWLLSEAFDQPEVFPLGHSMAPETKGIWLWIVPEKIKDSSGKECTVVLLDSEGIDDVMQEGFNDSQIFTLTVLLASVLIYNSQGVPARNDLHSLNFIIKLSQRIKLRSGNEAKSAGNRYEDTEYFHKIFPFFIWLLRDVTLSNPSGCRDIQEYFLTRVFKGQGSPAADQNQQVAENILRFFPGFRAFKLPPPACDGDVLREINRNKSQLNKKFLSELEDFKRLLKSILVTKKSFNDSEIVTGEGLAALVQLYVDATNTPGVVPNIQSAWETFVSHKCSEALNTAVQSYQGFMNAKLSCQLPCNNNIIRQVHNAALEPGINQIEADTSGISSITIEKCIKELKKSAEETLSSWVRKNETMTKESCSGLLKRLKRKHLDTVVAQLLGANGSMVSFDSIVQAYRRLEDDYHKLAKGAEDVCAAVFFEFYPELMKEMQQYTGILQQRKDFDENLARELAAKAYQQQEYKRLEEEYARVQQKNLERQQEFQLLKEKQEEERERLRRQYEAERRTQREQMQNMLKANMEKAEQVRNAFIQQNKVLQHRIQKMRQSNERMQENMEFLQDQLEDIMRRQTEVQEPGFLKKAFRVASVALPIIATVAILLPKCSIM